MLKKDTIAAIATAMSNSGIGIVRISGEDALDIITKIYRSKSGKCLADQKSHTIHYGYIADGEEFIDEVLVMLMKGPHSYTGEDTVEIDCHGGVFVVKRILETVIKYGARPAEPGEFTKRAFLNGRIDLSQAEAVIDVIEAQNEYALKSSVSQLKGSVHEKIGEVRAEILYHTAFIETALDDPEHIDVDGYGEILRGIVEKLLEELQKLINNTLEKLPERRMQIFKMHRTEGKKYAEIAVQLSLSVKTVEAEMTKTLRTLRKEIENYIQMK